jgi:hypothetical protein
MREGAMAGHKINGTPGIYILKEESGPNFFSEL